MVGVSGVGVVNPDVVIVKFSHRAGSLLVLCTNPTAMVFLFAGFNEDG